MLGSCYFRRDWYKGIERKQPIRVCICKTDKKQEFAVPHL